MRSWIYWLPLPRLSLYPLWTSTWHGTLISSWQINTAPTARPMLGVTWTMMTKSRRIIWPHRLISHVVHGSPALGFDTCIVDVPFLGKRLAKNSHASYTTHAKSLLSYSHPARKAFSLPLIQATITPSMHFITNAPPMLPANAGRRRSLCEGRGS